MDCPMCEHPEHRQQTMLELGLGVTRCQDCNAVFWNGRVAGWYKDSDVPGQFLFRPVFPLHWADINSRMPGGDSA